MRVKRSPRGFLVVMFVSSLFFIFALVLLASSSDNLGTPFSTLLAWVSAIAWLACAFLAIRPLTVPPEARRRERTGRGARLQRRLRPAMPAIVCVAVMLLSAWVYTANMRDFSGECYTAEDFHPELADIRDGQWADPEPIILTDHPAQRQKALRRISRDAVSTDVTPLWLYERTASQYTSSSRDPVGVQHCSYVNTQAGVDASWRVVHPWTTLNTSMALATYAIAFCVFARRLTSAYRTIHSDDTPPDPGPEPGEPSVGPASGA